MKTKLTPPETAADAILIRRTLLDDRLVGRWYMLTDRRTVEAARANALAWMLWCTTQARPITYTGSSGTAIDFDMRVDETLPGDYESVLDELPYSVVVPQAFNVDQSRLVLSVMRRAVRRTRELDVVDYLARNSPDQAERIVYQSIMDSVLASAIDAC